MSDRPTIPSEQPADADGRRGEEKEKRGASVRTGCIVTIVLLVAAGALVGWNCSRERVASETRVAYFPQPVEIDTRTEVLFHGEVVGRVVETRPNFAGIQFIVYDLSTWLRAVATLPLEGRRWIDLDNVEIDYNDAGTIAITNGGGTVQIARGVDGHWRFRGGVGISQFRLARYRRPIDSLAADSVHNIMRDGDLLLLETAQLEWRDPSHFTRAVVEIDPGKVKALAGDAYNTDKAGDYIGPGSELVLATNLGLSRPALKLVPAIESRSFATAGGGAAPADRELEREIIGNAGFDIEELLSGGANYLMAPSRLGAPARNNFEKMIFSTGSALDTFAALAADARLITSDASSYMSRPEYLNAPPATRMQMLVADLNVTAEKLKTLDTAIRRALLTVDRTVDNLDRSTRPKVDSAIDTLRASASRITTRIERLSATLQDTTLIQVDNTLVSATADLQVLTEDVHRLARSLNMLVQQLGVHPR